MNKFMKIEGALLKAISPLPYEKAQRLMGPISAKALGILPLKRLSCEKIGMENISRRWRYE